MVFNFILLLGDSENALYKRSRKLIAGLAREAKSKKNNQ